MVFSLSVFAALISDSKKLPLITLDVLSHWNNLFPTLLRTPPSPSGSEGAGLISRMDVLLTHLMALGLNCSGRNEVEKEELAFP